MAKKKEKFVSPFVPVEEWPYPVPENWCWVNLGTLIDLYHGVSYKKDDAHTEKLDDDYLIMRGGNILEGAINTDADNVYVNKQLVQEEQLVKKYDIIIVSSTGSSKVIGRAGISYNDYSDVAFGAFLLLARPNTVAVKPFVTLFFQSEIYRDRIRQLASGVNINNIRTDYIISTPIPLPPLPEQYRIVARIESLFAKLDEAKEKLQAVVDGFENRKAAILHKAFTGELTAKWREEHGVGLESWETSNLSDRFEIVGGIQKKPSRAPKDNPVPYLTVANVFRDRIDLSELRYFEVFDGELDKLRLLDKDILVVEGNGSGNEIGRCAMWHCELPICIHQNHIIRLRATDSETIPEYVLYFLNSSTGKSVMKERAKTTAGLFNLSTGKIRTIPIPFATVSEQKEIVHILDHFLTQERQAKEVARAALAQIDLIKKSIQARAFRGELGTNDPGEESAGELVKIAVDE